MFKDFFFVTKSSLININLFSKFLTYKMEKKKECTIFLSVVFYEAKKSEKKDEKQRL